MKKLRMHAHVCSQDKLLVCLAYMEATQNVYV